MIYATTRPGDRLNEFENGKTQLFNSWGVDSKKLWSVPLSSTNSLCSGNMMDFSENSKTGSVRVVQSNQLASNSARYMFNMTS